MESYVGLDVSLRRTSICVVDQTGKVLCEGTVNSTPEAIVEFVKSKAAGAVRIGLETGPTSTWLWTETKASPRGRFVYFRNEGHPGTVIEMAHATPTRMRIFDAVRAAAAGWDGNDPVRRQWPS